MPSADAAVTIAQALGVTVEYLVTGRELNQKPGNLLGEARMASEIIAQMEAKNRKMAVAIIKTMKKQEDEEKG
ncbi:MAG: hypothetical protein LBH42_04960 [Treponema sp.]|jgi:hypothetical protein|nr:hypothetical protein [Treponema sp.]